MHSADGISDRAVTAATRVAAEHRLPFSAARLIGGYSNTLVHLVPLPLVARVATMTGTVRSSNDWMAREVALATELAALGSVAVRPTDLLPPGPHERDGLALTFWELLAIVPGSPSPEEAGAALRAIHDALALCTVPLPYLGPIQEAYRMLANVPDASQVLGRSLHRVQHALDGRSMTCRALHGDAHHGNLWRVPERWVWGDLEDACTGPIEWNLACLTASSRVLGSGRAANEALEAYGGAFDAELLDVLIEARTLQAIAWAFVSLPEPAKSERLQKRLAWLSATYTNRT